MTFLASDLRLPDLKEVILLKNKMDRYFIAILLPDHAKDRLVAIQPEFAADLRRIERRDLHLTLHFIGALDAL